MGKRLFQILDEMNLLDAENNTRSVAVSNIFLSANKRRQGTEIAMGMDDIALYDIEEGKVFPLIILVNKREYLKLKDENQE
jgi:hypothetical protein